MKKKIIVLTSVLMMGLALFGCGNKGGNNSDKETMKNNNQYVIINGKTYDLSKECDEIVQEFIDDMYLYRCQWEDEEQPVRKKELNEKNETVYYELDKDGNYVETEQKDFDERIVMACDGVGQIQPGVLEGCYGFRIYTRVDLNASDFQMITPSGICNGSDIKELENTGACKTSIGGYKLIYLDGELVDYSDYYKDAERIQKLDDSEWAQEREKEFKYYNLSKEYATEFNKAVERTDIEHAAYMLAESDAYAKICSGEKDIILIFDYRVIDDKVSDISFEICKQTDMMKKNYEDFIANK